MPDTCDPIRAEITEFERQLGETDPFIFDPEGPRTPPRPNPAYRRILANLRDAKDRLRACEGPVVPPPPPSPVPVSLSTTGVRCFDQNDVDRGGIFDIEDDEPYVLAFAVDISLPANFTNSKLTKIGPIADVDEEGQFYSLPNNLIWGLSGSSQVISSANNFICIIACMENDDANTDTVRTIVEIDLQASLLRNLIPYAAGLINRGELVSRMINDMNGVIPIASVAFPGPDDQIGSATELRFLQDELDSIYRDGRVIEKKLYFEGDGAKYDVYFKMSR